MSEILYPEEGRKDMKTDMKAVVGTNAWGDAGMVVGLLTKHA